MRGRVERVRAFIAAQPDFELAAQPEANILCFRTREGSDKDQLELRKKLLARGGFDITSTLYRGRRWLCLVFMPSDTGLSYVQALIEEIRKIRG